jgi:SSS family solute:Na+ symporter
MIRHGPMIISMYALYPVIFIIAGYFLIPKIMQVRATSAYEILEMQLGVGSRMLGAVMFLALRIGWMAVIIYATVDKVLIPMLGLTAAATPYICAVLGLITVIYTSMGGLRAVVFTDVVQTLILFGGAILAMLLISITLGGIGAWFPERWPTYWPEPEWGYDPTARISFVGMAISGLTWWICTAGGDQMAIQRYLATRDAKAARAVLATSLIASTLIGAFLALLGLALLAYFRTHPQSIPDGQTIMNNADQLFPRFIVFALPMGITGLVIAGLLAAAMSSLSSGINSSCSVLTVDFVDRFRNRASNKTETDHVHLAKYISVLVGIIVVLLSTCVGMVKGNLLEVAFKVVNPLAAPIFGLFFMALFVRRATGAASVIGGAVGIVVVLVVSFWKEIFGYTGISFIWAMPIALIVQIAVGVVLSYVGIGRCYSREGT